MFSNRVPSSRQPNRITCAATAARANGRPLIDLTVSNPTTIGLTYPPSLLQPLAAPQALVYRPHPFGLEHARTSIARDYARRGTEIATDRIVLTSSTSEAYSLLFKLLCRPDGDAVLIPIPSYPLFDHLTQLDGVTAVQYQLAYHGRWFVDMDALDRTWPSTVKAVLAVSPNNPTGSVLSDTELDELARRCAERRAALIVDEVFADYPLWTSTSDGPSGRRLRRYPSRALTFRLGGLSKSAGLPQVKLGWIAVDGPDDLVREALDRLELICDTYLSVSTPVQVAAADLMAAGEGIRAQILERIRTNFSKLCQLGESLGSVDVLAAQAGWSAVFRVPSTRPEETLVLELIEHDDVLVHPGFYFDFPHEAFLVVSLLPEPATFADGVRRVMERVGA